MKRMLAALLALAMALTLLPVAALAITDVSISGGPTVTVEVGETITLTATVTADGGEAETVTWSDDGSGHAKVNSSTGEVTGKSVGNTEITATSTVDNSKTATVTITVTAAKLATPQNLSWSGTTASWDAVSNASGYTVELKLDGTPVATGNTSSNSHDFSADMTTPGNYTFTVTATSTDSNYTNSDTSAASAVKNVAASGAAVSGVSWTSATPDTIYVGESVTWTAAVSPADAGNKDLVWTSTTGAANVVDGTITAIAAGTTTIRAASAADPTKFVEKTLIVKSRVLSSIWVTTPPAKTQYRVGDSFDPAGMVVTARFQDNDGKPSEKAVPTGELNFTYSFVKVGASTVTISYAYQGGAAKTVTQAVSVVDDKVLTGITLDKTSAMLPEGSTLQLTATIVPTTAADPTPTVTWKSSDPSIAEVSSTGLVTPATPLKTGKVTITATATQPRGETVTKTAICTVQVTAKAVSGISIHTQPNRSTYRVGESFDPAGMVIEVTYTNGTTGLVSGSSATYSTSAFNAAGNVNFAISYGGKSVEIPLTITSGKLESIAVNTQPRTTYAVGEAFDKTGLTVTATFEGGATTVIDASKLSLSNTALSGPGTQNITISYTTGGVTKTTTLTVTITGSKLSGIAVKTVPNKVNYVVGEYFDKTGLVVTATLEDGTNYDVQAAKLSCTPTAALKEANTSVTISYTANGVTKTTTQAITVTNATLTGLKILTEPAKVSYNLGETLNKTGLTAEASFSDGSTRTITASQLACTPTTLNTAGFRTITASYTINGVKKSATFAVEVTSTPGSSSGTATIVNCNSWVNVRSGPSTAYSKIGTAAKGAQYEILGTSGNWYKVQYGSQIGWIYGAYVSTSGGGGTPSSGTATIVNCNSWVNVRSGPSTAYSKIGTAARGAQYEILGYATSSAGNRWYKVQYGSKVGWIYGQYVSTSGGGGGTATGYGYIGNCSYWVNVRTGPGTNYSKIGTAAKGSYYQILGTSGNWHKIQYTDTQAAWVYGNYLIHAGSIGTVTINTTTEVRSAASTSGTAIGTAAAGQSYTCLKSTGNWYMIAYGSRVGYVPTAYATMN